MTPVELVRAVATAGGMLCLNGDRIHCEIPEDAVYLLDQIREKRLDVFHVLREMQEQTLPRCPTCRSYCLYRKPDGRSTCLTCGPESDWQQYPF